MRGVWIATALSVAASVVLDVAFRHLAHTEYPWHAIPGFDFVYGLGGCALIVVASKWLGHAFLQRREGYYEAARDPRRDER